MPNAGGNVWKKTMKVERGYYADLWEEEDRLIIPVSYTHLDVYKRQTYYEEKEFLEGQIRDGRIFNV